MYYRPLKELYSERWEHIEKNVLPFASIKTLTRGYAQKSEEVILPEDLLEGLTDNDFLMLADNGLANLGGVVTKTKNGAIVTLWRD